MEKLWKAWQRKLIPLTSRNRTLVVTKSRPRFCLDLQDFDFVSGVPAHQWIEKALLGSSAFPLFPVVDPRDGRSNELSLALQAVIKTARTWTEETGVAPLHLGYPIVEGKTLDDQVIRGPLILIPVDIQVQDGHWVLTPQPPLWNQALFLAYGQSVHHIPPLDWPWETNSCTTLIGFLTELYAWMAQHMPGVRMDSALFQQTIHSFPHWRIADLQKRPTGELSLVSHALLGIFPPFASHLGDDYTVLMSRHPENPWSTWTSARFEPIREEEALDPLPIDASQENVLTQVQQGASLVVQGPPGSGKSQLITNLIARFTAQGKRVLVVCQKRAALETVHARLTALEATPFVALVTDIQRDRSIVFHQLKAQIAHLPDYELAADQWSTLFQDRTFRHASRQIDQFSEALEGVRKGLFTPLPMGWPMKAIYLALGDLPNGIAWESPCFHGWTEDRYQEKVSIFTRYLSYTQKINLFHVYFPQGITSFAWTPRPSPTALAVWTSYRAAWEACVPQLTLWSSSGATQIWDSFWLWWDKIVARPGCLTWFDQPIPSGVNAQTYQQLIEWTRQDLLPDEAPLALLEDKLQKRLAQTWRRWLGDSAVCLRYRQPNETDESFLARVRHTQAWRAFRQNYPAFGGETPTDWLNLWEDMRLARALRKQFPACPWRTLEEGTAGKKAWEQFQIWERAWGNEVDKTLLPHFRQDPDPVYTWVAQHRAMLFEISQLQANLGLDERALIPLLLADSSWSQTLRRSWLTYWVQYGEQIYPELSRLQVGHWEHVEHQLQEALATKQAAVRAQWIHTLRAQTIKDLVRNRLRNPITYRPLQHQIEKKRQIWSLRKLWQTYAEEISRLIPCWLVSPEAAAALFPLGETPNFDLVIFDEASQCPVEQGMPVLFRGKQVVIAGDTHQLRPSDLYQSVWEDEEDDSPELTVESLLDLAMWHLPTVELRGHYRSEHPDLIQFANRQFYQNKLQCLPTFSRWKQAEKPIHYHPVAGLWQGQQNEIEATYILSLLPKLIEPGLTVGVIAFNYSQARRIEQGVDAAGWTNVRVKNIENVQGDEFDIVIVSTTYGPTEKGVVHFNMGSLNRTGGENRLNVALTRAKQAMHIVSSLPLDQLRTAEEHAEGVQQLKQFLLEVAAYHQTGNWQNPGPSGELSKRLQGVYSLVPTPFGLLDQHDILWLPDDQRYESAATSKENHGYFPRLLTQKGWRYRRVWSREWAIGKNFGQSPPLE